MLLHERPLAASSWKDPSILALSRRRNVNVVQCDQCMFGLTVPNKDGVQTPARKPTKFMSNSDIMLKELGITCNRQHEHEPLLSGKPRLAETYPLQLVLAILRGMQKTMEARSAIQCVTEIECERVLSLSLLSRQP